MADDDEVYLWKGDFTADERRSMARQGTAMHDGSYPIPDAEHLDKAIHAVGRGTNNSHQAIRKHIIARARTLGLSSRIPDDWGSDGSVKKSETVELGTVPLWKSDARQLVYGVVLTPGLPDSQGDIVDAEQIEKAAHRWLIEYRKQDVQHSEVAKDDSGRPYVEPVESFIAPCDLTIEGEPVKKGAWVLASRVNDAGVWDDVVSGRRTGFSIGGSGVRTPIAV